MRWLALLVIISCAPARHVVVAKTDEGGRCWRECKGIEATCLNGRETAAGALGIGDSIRKRCGDACDRCLLTCPGAEWRE